MKTRFLKNVLILCLLACTACVEEYWPDLGKYENVLVVDGMITNEPGPYTIRLATSTQISNTENFPFPNAEIVIFDDIGNSETLTEINPGEYCTASDGIQGIVGRKYKIHIKTPGNKTYSSDFEEIIPCIEIDTVYSNVEYRQYISVPYDLVGLQFYLNTKRATKEKNYFLWKLESTYEYNSSFLITHIYNNFNMKPFYNCDSLFTCWKTEDLGEMYIASTVDLSEPQIIGFPLNYVSTEDRQLSVKYSLLIKQLTITEKIYDFWHNIDELNADQGALFSSLPYQIRGNIYCENDSEEPILGYFMATSISQKRIFVERPILDFNYYQCILSAADFDRIKYIRLVDQRTWPIYVTSSTTGIKAHPHQDCIDCTRKGGTLNMPEFWID